jgi:hypothetical protein
MYFSRAPFVVQRLAALSDPRVAHFSMRSGIEGKKNRVTGLLFKIDIAPALTFSVQTSERFRENKTRQTTREKEKLREICEASMSFDYHDIDISAAV